MVFGTVCVDGNLTGDVHIYDHLYGTLQITGDVGGSDPAPAILIEGFLAGQVVIEGNLNRDLEIRDKVHRVGGDNAVEIGGDLNGTITIDGDMVAGMISVYGVLRDELGDLSGGHIIVNGSFGQAEEPTAWIKVQALEGDTTFIAIDYDGWDSGDSWRNGVVRVGTQNYYGNTPEMRIWEITECKADMNNDQQVDFDDLDPFVLALSNPHGYALAYAGLGAVSAPWEVGGSRVFHGDLDCDEDLDFEDVDPFVTRVTQHCCIPECGDCPPRGGAALGPEALATELALHIAPQRYDDLVLLVAQTAAVQPDPQRRAYWQAVYDALTP